MTKHYQIVIVGGGTAGITVAARLLKKNENLKGKIAIIDPAEYHYYQPLWTLVGAGVSDLKSSRKSMAHVIPKGAQWIKNAVSSFQPDHNSLTLEDDTEVSYAYLVVAPGLQINWSSIKGLKENIGKNGVCSNYSPDYVNETWRQIAHLKQGNAIFTYPNTPVKCGGAPMKIMYLAEDYFRKHDIRSSVNVIYETPKDALFDVEKYKTELEKIVEERDIIVNFKYNLVEIDGDKKVASFEHIDTGERKTIDYEMLHVTPPMGPLDVIKESALSDNDGWVDIDPTTLQHKNYSNVFSLGDASNAPTSKTGAAIRKQAPIVVNNLLQVINSEMLTHHYDGYTSCPIVTGYNKLILAEFDYNKKPKETMPFNQAKERRSMYVFKKDLLPKMYWHGMLKGRM
ncbi:type II sulfide:quinone oxidoreductase Sqr [Staphylococcus delphini]|uniref:Pyridine nucleotide-disulfide oxidoreductase n=1 Tax=Staphylococcus delphini TaxID=53344 RepID=A0AAX0QTB3_9STAP|nr:type II sulfide:quinone oxidoreductase Sqr [Staphylococcus delphini]NBK47160.1 type II sulfide:quinone oxidoreductase Sqr [Staphylococcus delphini]PCF49118.1 pyridine nucleotide-disulfide oxidoreductase [Staphylococcus delphini]PNZ96132.1 pyridine nucleotide-disulfide oxidoreductase [Staphylococcus delphini]RIZ51795.1 pyridine nucleotide-disulfide oxidoreductase [Staphylococcus delphini]VED63088.1 FAD-dependent pyridine nucleotide-disulfide oxidoreductase [Staphylococcus delphini]